MSRAGRRGRTAPIPGPRVIVAVPFEGGVVLAADRASPVVKTPWGLLAGAGADAFGVPASVILARARERFRLLPPLAVSGVWAELARLSWPDPETAPEAPAGVGRTLGDGGLTWVFSHEVDPLTGRWGGSPDTLPASASSDTHGWLGAPVAAYKAGSAGPARARWGAVVVMEAPESAGGAELRQGAALYLQGGLDQGADLATRLRLAQGTVVWAVRVGSGGWGDTGEPPRDLEVVVGIHEVGHSYSVDRVGLGGLTLPAE